MFKNARGAKQKGVRLELKVAAEIRRKGIDKDATRMPLSGSVWSIRTDINSTIPFSIECKNNEKHRLWEEWEQACAQASMAKPPVLIMSGNHRPILVTMNLNDWLDLVKEAKIELPEALRKLRGEV